MKFEISYLALSIGGAATSAATAVATQSGAFAIGMMALAGVCAIVAALYYRSESDEKIARDAIVSIAMAFIVGAAGGEIAGTFLDGLIFDRTGLHLSTIAQHMVGGAALGATMTPLTRSALSGKLGEIWRAVTGKGKAP